MIHDNVHQTSKDNYHEFFLVLLKQFHDKEYIEKKRFFVISSYNFTSGSRNITIVFLKVFKIKNLADVSQQKTSTMNLYF